MAIVLSGTTNDITVNGVSVATDAEVSSAVASLVSPKANTSDLKEIGVGQTWQNVIASRTRNVTYTNTTGKPIEVNIAVTTLTSTNAYGYVETGVGTGVFILVSGDSSSAGIGSNHIFIVPNGFQYKLTTANTPTINTWSELR